MLITRTIDSFHFGFFLKLTDSQLRTLAGNFTQTDPTGVSALGGRTAVTRTKLDNIGSVVIKHYRRGGLMRYIFKRQYLDIGKTRAHREFELLNTVHTLDVNVPEPIAFAYSGHLLYRAWLVTREIHQSISLARLSLQNENNACVALQSATRQISSLIENSILHVDLHPGNVVVDGSGKVYLLDFDKGRIYHGNRQKLKIRYLARWQRAVEKHGLPKSLSEMMQNGL